MLCSFYKNINIDDYKNINKLDIEIFNISKKAHINKFNSIKFIFILLSFYQLYILFEVITKHS